METKNVVVLIGRLVTEPELRFTPEGKSVANFSLAVNRSFRGDDGQWHDKFDGFFDCEYFSRTAEKFAEDFKKGDLIQVTGSLHQNKYKVGTKPNEKTVSKILVTVKTISSVLIDLKLSSSAEEAAPAATNGQPVAVPQPA